MMILIFAALIAAAPFVTRSYLRLATRALRRASGAWTLVERHAHVLLEDRRLNPLVGDMVEVALTHAGDARLTRYFLLALVTRRRRPVNVDLDRALETLNADQEKQFLHFMVAVLFFDSLNSPILGGVLRKLLYWLAATAADRTAPVSRDAVEPAMTAVGRMCVAA